MVEMWPYMERSRGLAIFQLWGRLASFFTTFVNPIGLENSGWRYLISYCCWLAFEVVFVYFMFPETFGRTLEELAFSTYYLSSAAGLFNVYPIANQDFQCSRTRLLLTRPSLLSRRWLTMRMRRPVKQSIRKSGYNVKHSLAKSLHFFCLD
jgi:hypothetical protein